MKVICFIMVLFCSLNLIAQDREPSPWNFVWGYDAVLSRPFVPDSFFQKNVITGIQWGTTLNMNNSLLNNSMGVHGYPEVTAGSRICRMQITDQPVWRDSRFKEQVFNTNNLTNIIFGANISASKKIFAHFINFA